MTIFDHPIWAYVLPYAHMPEGRDNVDFLQLPDQLREIALGVVTNCVSCSKVVHPLRARALSERSRIAGTAIERRLFYAPTCPTDVDPGCSRTKAAQAHKDFLKAQLKLVPVGTYDALCLQEPYLELVLGGVKTLETRTKCLRKKGGEVLLTSSKSYDVESWNRLSGRFDVFAVERAMKNLGTLAGLVVLGDARPGVPGVDDVAACIEIALPSGASRWVWPITAVRRVERVPTVRRSPSGALVEGASQGFFKVPKSLVKVA